MQSGTIEHSRRKLSGVPMSMRNNRLDFSCAAVQKTAARFTYFPAIGRAFNPFPVLPHRQRQPASQYGVRRTFPGLIGLSDLDPNDGTLEVYARG
ncbi:hypothetical protein MRX96_042267 [Rhipicephalus microplus]